MTARGRRLAVAFAAPAVLLLAGRWLAAYLAGAWWAGALSPDALTEYTRRTLVGLGLDLAATGLATAWWAAHLTTVVRSARAVPGSAPGGNPRVRALLAESWALGAAVAVAVALGLVTGVGTSEWTPAVRLALEGVTVGVPDPALGLDAGVYLAALPLWLRLHAFATVLVIGSFGLVLGCHLLAGSIRLRPGRPSILPAARRQMGLLLSVLALVLVVHQILIPYQLAAGLPSLVDPEVVRLYRSVSFVTAGVGLAVTGLSAIWAWRPIHSLLAGSWIALLLFVAGSFFLLPEGTPWPPPASPTERAALVPLEAVAFGISVAEAESNLPTGIPVPSLWQAEELPAGPDAGDAIRTRLPRVAGLVRTGSDGPRPRSHPVSAAIEPGPGGGGRLLLALEDTAAALGQPVAWNPVRGTAGAWGGWAIPRAQAHPGQRGIVFPEGPGGGIRLGSLIRRAVLAWDRQALAVFGGGGDGAANLVNWDLDPADRLRRVAGFADWIAPRPVFAGGRLVWVLDGVVSAETFPAARRVLWSGRQVGYARAGFIGVVEAETGSVRIALRDAADPLSQSWARAAGPLVGPAAQLDSVVLAAASPPGELLVMQAKLWAGDEAERLGRRAPEELETGVPVPGGVPGTWAVPVFDTRAGRLLALLEATGADRRLVVHRPDSVGLEVPAVLTRRWRRLPLLDRLTDSIVATGARLVEGEVRYQADLLAPPRPRLIAYQPFWAVSPVGDARLVAVGVAVGNRIGAGRSWDAAVRSATGREATAIGPDDGEPGTLRAARRWLREADSAFRAGDLIHFGRAFAALREALLGDTTSGPPPLP